MCPFLFYSNSKLQIVVYISNMMSNMTSSSLWHHPRHHDNTPRWTSPGISWCLPEVCSTCPTWLPWTCHTTCSPTCSTWRNVVGNQWQGGILVTWHATRQPQGGILVTWHCFSGVLQVVNLSYNQLVNTPSFSRNILLSSLDVAHNGKHNEIFPDDISNTMKYFLTTFQTQGNISWRHFKHNEIFPDDISNTMKYFLTTYYCCCKSSERHPAPRFD